MANKKIRKILRECYDFGEEDEAIRLLEALLQEREREAYDKGKRNVILNLEDAGTGLIHRKEQEAVEKLLEVFLLDSRIKGEDYNVIKEIVKTYLKQKEQHGE